MYLVFRFVLIRRIDPILTFQYEIAEDLINLIELCSRYFWPLEVYM